MKSLPTHKPDEETTNSITALLLNTDRAGFSTSNRKVSSCPIQRVYPWLLFASAAIAATFCLAYITKPVILPAPSQTDLSKLDSKSITSNDVLSPDTQDTLPADDHIGSAGTGSRSALPSDFEATDIRLQHVLDAEISNGDVNRLTIDVPVLYRSRNLRWSQTEAEQARVLLERLKLHQEQVLKLRDQGTVLLNEWNSLVRSSIPGEALHADSPSLPANQKSSLTSAPSSSDTVETRNLRKSKNEK